MNSKYSTTGPMENLISAAPRRTKAIDVFSLEGTNNPNPPSESLPSLCTLDSSTFGTMTPEISPGSRLDQGCDTNVTADSTEHRVSWSHHPLLPPEQRENRSLEISQSLKNS